MRFDIAIIGGGILGLSTALNLLKRRKDLSIALFEKEEAVALHQTGRSSGVIHSGVYYKPGSSKAKNCRKGVCLLVDYCREKKIPIDFCGKVIVAKNQKEEMRLQVLYERGVANGVPGLRKLSLEELREIEPHAAGISALHSPMTGVVDFTLVAKAYAEDVVEGGGAIHLSEKVMALCPPSQGGLWGIETTKGEYLAKRVVNCAGFHADRVAHLGDPAISPKQIIPFRGEYFELKPEKRALVNGLIYPIPDPEFPFLGVHLSKTIDGRVEAGPNAVLALSREGYSRWTVSFRDCLALATYPGFWALARRYWQVGCFELYRSFSKRAFLKSLQSLVPELKLEDLIASEAGVRSQVVLQDGTMQDDFLIVKKRGLLNVLNAPSPAATASLAIGEVIADELGEF